MTTTGHRIYIGTLSAIVIVVTIYLFYMGSSYYNAPMEERFYHADHARLKPSGHYGHGLGIIGTLLILIGVFGYMARKRYRSLSRIGVLKYWLEFHIFLCTLGPIMILFHTAFKFGGIVSISFWSMVAVVASGVLGRFIYLQIPRTVQGRELSVDEIHDMKEEVREKIEQELGQTAESEIVANALTANRDIKSGFFGRYFIDYQYRQNIRSKLVTVGVGGKKLKNVVQLIDGELSITRKIDRLRTMQNLFRYWHIAHLPFAVIMLVIMLVHVGVTLAFGYKWIF